MPHDLPFWLASILYDLRFWISVFGPLFIAGFLVFLIGGVFDKH